MELSLEGNIEIDGFVYIFFIKEGLNCLCKSFYYLYSVGCFFILFNKIK